MKNSADLGQCYPPRPSSSLDNTLLDLHNSSYPIQPHSIIANYCFGLVTKIGFRKFAEFDVKSGKGARIRDTLQNRGGT